MTCQICTDRFSDWLLAELVEAYHKARVGGKRKTHNEHNLEMNEIENLVNLRNAILARQYHPNRGVAFIIRDPVQREIFAAPFVDRVVHHFLFKYAIMFWEPRLWRGSYSCRKGKGTLAGIIDLQKNMRRVSKDGSIKTVVVKRDIQGYFMSLDHDRLYKRILWGLNQQFPNGGELYRTLKYLWKEIIFDDPTRDVTIRGKKSDWDGLPASKSLFSQPKNKGIVIGNLTSQLLSNIYLDQLDRYIVYRLGYKAYGRYVDDSYLVVPEADLPKLLTEDMPKIKNYLAHLGLKMHPKKQTETPIQQGVDFLGARVFLDHITPGKRLKGNLANWLRKYTATGEGKLESLTSYDGLLAHYDSEKMIRKLFRDNGQEYQNSADRDVYAQKRGKSGRKKNRKN